MPMLETNTELYRGLTYPWGRGANPTPGEPHNIADGVHWGRFAMPMSFNHINLWLMEDEDG